MDAVLVEQTSLEYLGQWRRLVSTTNWEKGKIIHDWREALRAARSPASQWTDEAWSRQVGNVTPQHVGRLRRVFERFFDDREEYPGLYWSHFQAAVDWDDAPMWLEGAVHSQWSISQMREQRWQATGADGGVDEPIVEPWDEDADADSKGAVGTIGIVGSPERVDDRVDDEELETEPGYDHSQFDEAAEDRSTRDGDEISDGEPPGPLADLPSMPPDIGDAFEAFKLCILRHKLAGWREISLEGMLRTLESLKQLCVATDR